MPRNREVSWDFTNQPIRSALAAPRPDTAIEALMECAPGDNPEPSSEELLPLREVITCALERILTERERWIFDGLFTRRLSERQMAAELSLSRVHVRRIRDESLIRLQDELLTHPAIKEYLQR